MERSSGVLMSISSLPSPYGIGTLGKSAYRFVDFLKDSGQRYWQLLPLGPTSYGDSPYASFSSFAGNPYFVDLELLIDQKLLKKSEVEAFDWGNDPERVDYGRIYESRFKVLRIAFSKSDALSEEINKFRSANSRWIETYALYMSLKAKFNQAAWTEWPDEAIRMHRPEAVEKYSAELKEELDFYVFIQYLFYQQWNALREYVHANGIELIGDIPIYVAMDSADVWSEAEFFQLDDRNVPTEVSGVPPDPFTEDGQLWGNPLYDWDKMLADGFGWWLRRIDGALALYDIIRIDHFRGLESYYAVPYGAPNARNGRWVSGPGKYFVYIIKSWFQGIRIIAEDLGYVTPEVRDLLDFSGFPGMKILEFAFNQNHDYDYLPHNCTENSVVYLGTHDNATVSGWLKETPAKEKKFTARYINISEPEGWTWGLIRSGMSTSSRLFVMQMQDILELGPDARMNVPGSSSGNWQWRMQPSSLSKKLSKKLYDYTAMYGRTAQKN